MCSIGNRKQSFAAGHIHKSLPLRFYQRGNIITFVSACSCSTIFSSHLSFEARKAFLFYPPKPTLALYIILPSSGRQRTFWAWCRKRLTAFRLYQRTDRPAAVVRVYAVIDQELLTRYPCRHMRPK